MHGKRKVTFGDTAAPPVPMGRNYDPLCKMVAEARQPLNCQDPAQPAAEDPTIELKRVLALMMEKAEMAKAAAEQVRSLLSVEGCSEKAWTAVEKTVRLTGNTEFLLQEFREDFDETKWPATREVSTGARKERDQKTGQDGQIPDSAKRRWRKKRLEESLRQEAQQA